MKLTKRTFVATSLVLVAIASASYNSLVAQPQDSAATVFRAESLLIVRRSSPPLAGTKPKANAAEDRAYANTQKVLVTSPFVLAAALRKPEIQNLSFIKDHEEPLQWLAENIHCEFVDDSEILRVSLRGKKRGELKAIVDAVVDAYFNEIVQSEKIETTRRLTTLRKQRRTNEQTFKEKAEIVHRLAKELGTADSEQALLLRDLKVDEVKQLSDRRARLTSKLDEVVVELQVMQALSADDADSSGDEKQQMMRVLKLRAELLEARIGSLEKEIAERRQELEQRVGFSADLEARKVELTHLRKLNSEIAAAMACVELELADRPRVQRVQPAVVMRIHDINAGQ